jgi:hypothetical protein
MSVASSQLTVGSQQPKKVGSRELGVNSQIQNSQNRFLKYKQPNSLCLEFGCLYFYIFGSLFLNQFTINQGCFWRLVTVNWRLFPNFLTFALFRNFAQPATGVPDFPDKPEELK